MTLHEYLTIGRSGLRVSPLCLGAMTFGTEWGWGSTPDESARIIDIFRERGGNFIDTANIYTRGHSEKIIGDYCRARPGVRDRLVIATKFMGNLFPGDPNGGGAGRKAVLNACEESLRRMQTDHVDLYWQHFWDKHTPIEETMRALDDLVRAGKVRYIGFSDTPAWKCAQAQLIAQSRGWAPLVALQVEYSLLERTIEGELAPMALELGLGITPWSPLKGGVLSGKYSRTNRPAEGRGASEWVGRHLTDRTFGVLDVLSSVAAEAGCSAAQAALAWVQGRPGVASTIIGARTLAQLEDNLKALEVRLAPEHVKRLEDATRPTLNFPAEFLTFTRSVVHGGMSLNGEKPEPWPLAPRDASERF
jgi:aryl-alcohol dehydrogenase-like predicted oxidoreductase